MRASGCFVSPSKTLPAISPWVVCACASPPASASSIPAMPRSLRTDEPRRRLASLLQIFHTIIRADLLRVYHVTRLLEQHVEVCLVSPHLAVLTGNCQRMPIHHEG